MKKKHFGFLMLWQRTVLLIIGYSVAIIVLISAIVLGVITLIRDDNCAEALFNFFWMLTGAGILLVFLKGVMSLILCIVNCRFTFRKCKIDRQDVSKQLDYFISRSFSKTNFVGEYYIKCSAKNKNSIKLITKVLKRHINKVFGWLKLLDYVGYIITFDNNDCDISFIDKILKKQKAFFVFVGIENIDKQKQAKIHAWMSSSNDVVSYFVINDDSNQALAMQSYGRYFLCETEGKEANKTEVNNDFDISDYWDNYFLNCEIAFHKYKSYFDENPNNPSIAFVYGITCFELDKHDIAPNVYECSKKTDDIVLKERLQIVYVMLTHGNAIKLAEIETNDILSKCVRNPVNALCARHMAEHLRLEKGDFASNKGSLLEDYSKTINDMKELNKKTLSKNDRYFLLYNLKHAISDYLRLLFIHDVDRSESRCLVNNFFGYLSDTDYGKNHSKDIDQFKEYYIDINILLYEDYKSRCNQLNDIVKSNCNYANLTYGNSQNIIAHASNVIYSGKSTSGLSLKSINDIMFSINFETDSASIRNNKQKFDTCLDICNKFVYDATKSRDIVDSHISCAYFAIAYIRTVQLTYDILTDCMFMYDLSKSIKYDSIAKKNKGRDFEIKSLLERSKVIYKNYYNDNRCGIINHIIDRLSKFLDGENKAYFKNFDNEKTGYKIVAESKKELEDLFQNLDKGNNDIFYLRLIILTLQSLILYLQ